MLSAEAQAAHDRLSASSAKPNLSIFNAVQKKADLIKENPHYGDPISKPLIPIQYRQQYGITNLFRVELPQFWRLLYTLTHSDTGTEII